MWAAAQTRPASRRILRQLTKKAFQWPAGITLLAWLACNLGHVKARVQALANAVQHGERAHHNCKQAVGRGLAGGDVWAAGSARLTGSAHALALAGRQQHELRRSGRGFLPSGAA